MPRRLDAADLIIILGVAILLFGGKLGGKSWQEMADQFAQAIQQLRDQFAQEIQQLRGGDPRAQIDPAMVRDLTVLGIACTILALELSWLATQI